MPEGGAEEEDIVVRVYWEGFVVMGRLIGFGCDGDVRVVE